MGYQTYATRIEWTTEPTEWLYDVAWLRATEDFLVRDVILVAEIEWGNARAVQQDFQKLLLARADCRVMIFDDTDGLRERLIDQAKKFRKSRRGDRYLFASYRDEKFTVHEEII